MTHRRKLKETALKVTYQNYSVKCWTVFLGFEGHTISVAIQTAVTALKEPQATQK